MADRVHAKGTFRAIEPVAGKGHLEAGNAKWSSTPRARRC